MVQNWVSYLGLHYNPLSIANILSIKEYWKRKEMSIFIRLIIFKKNMISVDRKNDFIFFFEISNYL